MVFSDTVHVLRCRLGTMGLVCAERPSLPIIEPDGDVETIVVGGPERERSEVHKRDKKNDTQRICFV